MLQKSDEGLSVRDKICKKGKCPSSRADRNSSALRVKCDSNEQLPAQPARPGQADLDFLLRLPSQCLTREAKWAVLLECMHRVGDLPMLPPGKKHNIPSSPFNGVARKRRACGSVWTASVSTKAVSINLGTFMDEAVAARAHDLAALLFCSGGTCRKLNFEQWTYEDQLERLKGLNHADALSEIKELRSASFEYTAPWCQASASATDAAEVPIRLPKHALSSLHSESRRPASRSPDPSSGTEGAPTLNSSASQISDPWDLSLPLSKVRRVSSDPSSSSIPSHRSTQSGHLQMNSGEEGALQQPLAAAAPSSFDMMLELDCVHEGSSPLSSAGSLDDARFRGMDSAQQSAFAQQMSRITDVICGSTSPEVQLASVAGWSPCASSIEHHMGSVHAEACTWRARA